MGRNIAIVIGAALIAGAILITNHWELGAIQGSGASTPIRLNRWTGTVEYCVPDARTLKGESIAGMLLACSPP